MAEENNGEVNQEQTPAPKQLSEVEQRAQEQGWVPQEEWTGEPDQWRPAKEFIDRGELFKKIDEQNRTIKQFKQTLDEFSKHHARVQETEYKRALTDLKNAKKEALVEGDADAVIDIDEKIALVREAQQNVDVPRAPDVPQGNPIFDNWVERNSWYVSNRAMKAFADDVGKEYGAKGMSPSDILAAVEREVKKEFADKFTNPNRAKAPGVEGSSNKGGGKGKDSFTLSDDERRIMTRFVKSGVLTEAQYIADLKKTKGVA